MQDTLQEIKEFEGDLGHVQETICRRYENTKRYRHVQETMCTRSGNTRRERTYVYAISMYDRTGNVEARRDMCKRQCAGDQGT